jgi:hypothetical protein
MIRYLLGLISTFSPIIPLLTGIKRKPGLIWIYILLGLVFNILIGKILRDKPNHDLFGNIYVYLEYILISVYFFYKLNRRQRWAIHINFILFLFLLYYTLTHNIFIFNGFCAAALSFSYIIYCILAMYNIMLDANISSVFESPFFICTIALFIYFSGMVMLLSTMHYFATHEQLWGFKRRELMSGLWMVNSTCNIIQSILFTWAFMVERKHK